MSVFAPFRFAPIHRWVYFPEWGPLVSHDVPFANGLSGEIELEIVAKTPILVGGARRAPSEALEGEVWPFQLPDGRWALPGSSLQGMVRSILEIATFARLGPWIDERRFGFRDISGTGTAKLIYQDRMTTLIKGKVTHHAKPGWLVRTADGPVIVKCDVARIHFLEVARLKNPAATAVPAELSDGTKAHERYSWFLNGGPISNLNRTVHLEAEQPHKHKNNTLSINYRRAFAQTGPKLTPVNGTLVFTGKPNSGMTAGRKKLEFVFHTPDRSGALAASSAPTTGGKQPLPISTDVWGDFELIHGEQPGRPENPNWTFWKENYFKDEPVPVFYLLEGGRVTTFFTAFMGKAAQPLSSLDLLKHSHRDHVADESDMRHDFPSLLFGAVAGKDRTGGLKRRITFDAVIAELPAGKTVEDHGPAILLGPKPNYYPIYVRQPKGEKAGELRPLGGDERVPYATYTSIGAAGSAGLRKYDRWADLTPEEQAALNRPELAGSKVWPARKQPAAVPQITDQKVLNNKKVQTRVRSLPAGTVFGGVGSPRVRFHNLLPIELGALLWALTIGDEAALAGNEGKRHLRLGMGKPYGFGQISIRVKKLSIPTANPNPTAAGAVEDFVKHMSEAYQSSGDVSGGWATSLQVLALKQAALPSSGQFDYMKLGSGKEPPPQSYVGERRASHFLPTYVVEGNEVPRLEPPAGSGQPVATGNALEPRVGARIQMTVGLPLTGEITREYPNEPKWEVRLDGQTKLMRYKASLFAVIG